MKGSCRRPFETTIDNLRLAIYPFLLVDTTPSLEAGGSQLEIGKKKTTFLTEDID